MDTWDFAPVRNAAEMLGLECVEVSGMRSTSVYHPKAKLNYTAEFRGVRENERTDCLVIRAERSLGGVPSIAETAVIRLIASAKKLNVSLEGDLFSRKIFIAKPAPEQVKYEAQSAFVHTAMAESEFIGYINRTAGVRDKDISTFPFAEIFGIRR